MLQNDKLEDFVLATGEAHSVREFIEEAFRVAGFEIYWEGRGLEEKGRDAKTGKVLVEVSPEFYRPAEVDVLVGDYSKAKKILGWEPKTTFKELVRIMVEEDLIRVRDGKV